MNASELESKIYYAVKFIVKRLAIPELVLWQAAEAAVREIVRYQKEQVNRTQESGRKEEAPHENPTDDASNTSRLQQSTGG